jgi:hypothetical protein
MLSRLLTVLVLLSVIIPCAAQGPARYRASRYQASRYQPRAIDLFNGKDFSGWDGDSRFWYIVDGTITGITTKENPTPINTFLIWRGGKLKDFELSVKYRILGGNSGIQYRSKDLGDWHVGGYQGDFEFGERYNGIIYEERGRRILADVGEKTVIGEDGKPKKVGEVGDPAVLRAAIRKAEWNDYVITARGNHLRHEINGRVTAETTDDDVKGRAMEGILALQLHQGPPMIVQFKEIRLRVLDSADAK